MANKHNRPHKDKKRSGHVQAELLIPKKIAIEEGLDQEGKFWDDWADKRDSMRDWYGDRSRIKSTHLHHARFSGLQSQILHDNAKLKVKEKIRKARKK